MSDQGLSIFDDDETDDSIDETTEQSAVDPEKTQVMPAVKSTGGQAQKPSSPPAPERPAASPRNQPSQARPTP